MLNYHNLIKLLLIYIDIYINEHDIERYQINTIKIQQKRSQKIRLDMRRWSEESRKL